MTKYSFLATASLMFNVVSFYWLVYKIHITKNASSFNWATIFGNVIAQILLIIYGLVNKLPEIYGPTALLLIPLIYLSYLKFKYHPNDDETKL
jgi:hypothetical protein